MQPEFESYKKRYKEAKKSFETLLAKGLERDALSRAWEYDKDAINRIHA